MSTGETTLEDLVAQEAADSGEEATAEETAQETPESEETSSGEEETEDVSGEEGATEDASGDESDSFFDDLATTGYDWKGKYATKEAALEGLKHLVSTIGQRSEDAQDARALREKLGEEGYRRLLAGETPPAATSEEPDQSADLLSSYDDMLLAQQAAMQEGATPEVRQRAQKLLDTYNRRVFDLVTNPGGVLAGIEEIQTLKSQVDDLKQSTTETSTRAAETAWTSAHASEIFTDGELNMLGKRVQGILETEDPDLADIPHGVPRLNAALWKAKAEMPKPKPTRKVKKEAEHQKSPGRGGDDLRSDEEQMDAALETLGDEAFLKQYVPSLGADL
jgi:hypothetical protein